MDKQAVLAALRENRMEFLKVIENLPEQAMLEPGFMGDFSVKDLLAHLNAWEAELIKLLWQVEQGTKPTTIHFGKYNVDALNQQWYEESRDRPLDLIWNDFKGIRNQTIRRVEALKEAEINNPKRYPWLQERPLWKWIADDTFAHEAEHLEQLKQWKDEKGY